MTRSAFVRRMMQLGCIFLLLFAQQTALTHAIWHYAGGEGHAREAHAHEQHAADDDAHAHDSDTVHDALCVYHAALGEALGLGLSSAVLLLHPAPADLPHARPPQGRIKAEAVAAVSRGPPTSL